jgi:hypothetical protein
MTTGLLRILLATLSLVISLGAGAQGLGGLQFGELERELKLKPEQKVQFDLAVGATQRALLSVGLAFFQQKARIAEEIGKPHPDLGALAQSQEELIALVSPNFREAREEWSRLYGMLEPDQVVIAKAHVEKQIGRLERMGAQLLQGLRDKLRP